ncbi:MAG: CHAT domain-containing tetratricopeptide repeat protein [Candidatus Zixiibacteriota bacterium]
MISLSQIARLTSREAFAKFLAAEYGGDKDAFVDDLDKSINRLIRTDLKEAGQLIDAVKAVFKFLPREYYARLKAIQGRYCHWTGDYAPALRHYLSARRMLERQRNFGGMARLGKGLMDVYMYLGRYKEALEVGRKSVSYFRKKKASNDTGQVLNNIGNIYHRMDNNRMALQYYNMAREIFAPTGGIPLAIVEYNRANVYANMDRLNQAEKLYLASAELYHENGLEIARNQALYSIAYLYFLRDQYTDAIKALETVHDDLIRLGDRKSAATAMLDMAEIDIQLNQFGSASMIADQIIPEFKKLGMRYEQAKASYFSADVRIKLGDYVQASRRLKTAQALFSKEGNLPWLGMISISRSKLNIARKQYSEAIAAADEAARLFARTGNNRKKIDAEIARLAGFTMAGESPLALRLARRLSTEKLVGYQKYNLNYLTGQCHYRLGRYETALRYFRRAVDTIEKMLTGLYPDEVRYFFISDKYDCYRRVVDCLLRLGRTDESLQTNFSALELINGKIDRDTRITSKIPPHLIDRREQLRAALRKISQSPKSGQRGAAANSYYSLEQQLWSNERKIRSILYPDEIDTGKRVAAEYNIRDFLQNDETIINYIESDSEIGAFCATSRKTEFVKLPVTASDMSSMLRKLHFIFESVVSGITDANETGQISESYLKELYSILFEPLKPKIVGKKLIIVADGYFGQIPFNALKEANGEYLINKYQVCLAVNPVDICMREKNSPDITNKQHAVFAVSSDLLPAISIEARQIKNIFENSHLYLDKEADRDNLLKEAQKATGFIHIAAHASRASENPLFSRILMGDGPFFPFDLFHSGLKAGLVTLSGCQTAAPGLYYGNSFSLAKAFYQAGSRYVLATLWPVADRVSTLFMIKFYKSLSEKKEIFDAYYSAVSELAEVTGNPAFWSSFVLLGI